MTFTNESTTDDVLDGIDLTGRRFVITGANLDVLRKVEVNLEGMTLQEETDVETAPTRDSERFEWPPRVVNALTTSPVKATVTVLGSGGSRWRHQLPIRYDEELDDSVMARGAAFHAAIAERFLREGF